MKALLLIPSRLKTDVATAVAEDRHPTMDYYALEDALRAKGATVTFLDYRALEASTHPLVRFAKKVGGDDAGLAMLGFLHRREADVIFTNGENVGMPLALLFRAAKAKGEKRVGHVTIGHKLSTKKKQLLLGKLGLHREMDTIFVYATTQLNWGKAKLGIPESVLKLIPFHADARFYRPLAHVETNPNLVSAAGLEWRDYPTLIGAIADQKQLSVRLAAASPWSKHTNETEKTNLPSHVDARRYEYNDLRTLYAESAMVAVPLYENDFQAGVTTLLEAMAMGKPVIVTQTEGQTDVVTDGVNGLTVEPGDQAGWRHAIELLQSDPELRARLGANARRFIEEKASLDRWAVSLTEAIFAAQGVQERSTTGTAGQRSPGKASAKNA
jgi:glycosyltransferase involved in cell wall biosynthesis